MKLMIVLGLGLTILTVFVVSCVPLEDSAGTGSGTTSPTCSEYCEGDTQYWCDKNGEQFYWECKSSDNAAGCELVDQHALCLVPCPAGTTSYCDGNVVHWCYRLQDGKDYVFSSDCSTSGKSCGWVPDVCEYDCIGCDGHDPGDYWCEGNEQHRCTSNKVGRYTDCEELGTTCGQYGCDVFKDFGTGGHCTNNFALNCSSDGACSWTDCSGVSAQCEVSAVGAECTSCDPDLLFPKCSFGNKAVCENGILEYLECTNCQ